MNYEFVECDTCRAKSGSPTLCAGCLSNRAALAALRPEEGSVIIKLPRRLYDVLLGGAFEMVEEAGAFFATLPKIEQELFHTLVKQHQGEKPLYLREQRRRAASPHIHEPPTMPGARQDQRVVIEWTEELAKKLRKQYHDAVTNGRNQFVFIEKPGVHHDFLTSYAKYLLEHLSNSGVLPPDKRVTQ